MAQAKWPPPVKLSPTFRLIRNEDAELPFRSGESLGTLAEFVALRRREGNIVVVKEVDDAVLGVVLVLVEGSTLTIERLARDLDHGYKASGASSCSWSRKNLPHTLAPERSASKR